VVFDETIFPFASLHPNAGARLRAELALLLDVLLNSSTNFGDAFLHDQTSVNSMPTNVTSNTPVVLDDTGTKMGTRMGYLGERTEEIKHHFMCLPPGGSSASMRSNADPPALESPAATRLAFGIRGANNLVLCCSRRRIIGA
jgi:hypothetical protein